MQIIAIVDRLLSYNYLTKPFKNKVQEVSIHIICINFNNNKEKKRAKNNNIRHFEQNNNGFINYSR